MIVLVTGDRNWKRMDIIEREFKKLPKDTIIIHGAARGADTLAGFVADKLGMKVMESEKGVKGFPAKWNIYGRGAGPIRNQVMIDKILSYPGVPKKVLAFHNNIAESLGTKDMVTRARKAGLSVEIIKE